MNGIEAKYEFAKDLLGPIFYEFCAKLHTYLLANTLDNSQEAVVLYMARAGLRLRYLYNLYRRLNNYQPVCDEKDFYISRLSAAKACLVDDFEYVAPIIVREYSRYSIAQLLKGVVYWTLDLPDNWHYLNASFDNFKRVYWFDNSISKSIRKYFIEQSNLFRKYVKNLVQSRSKVFLVDSGWTGNTQAMLMRSFPSIRWTGLYFGKWDYRKVCPSHFSQIVGLCLDDAIHDETKPQSAMFHYHHLIEDPLEIKFPSTEGYTYNKVTGEVTPNTMNAEESILAPHQEDIHFAGIVEYFQFQQPSSLEKICENAEQAYSQLKRFILFPKKKEITMMTVRDRSADFGKDESNSILIQPQRFSLQEKRRRILQALWKEGQVTLEFPPAIAWIIQRLVKFNPAV